MATQIVMDRTGDTRHNFDAKNADALLKAEERFRELTGAGFTAAVRTASGEAVVKRTFDPTADSAARRRLTSAMFRQLLRNAKERLRLFLSERGRRARVLRDRLRRSTASSFSPSQFVPGFRHGHWAREERGLELLKELLSPEQFARFVTKSYFEVTGCHSGKRY